jgi:hypothetical protein
MTPKSILLLICHIRVHSKELRGGLSRHRSNIFERHVTSSRTYLKNREQIQTLCLEDPRNPLCRHEDEPQERNVISPIDLDFVPKPSPVGTGLPNISPTPSSIESSVAPIEYRTTESESPSTPPQNSISPSIQDGALASPVPSSSGPISSANPGSPSSPEPSSSEVLSTPVETIDSSQTSRSPSMAPYIQEPSGQHNPTAVEVDHTFVPLMSAMPSVGNVPSSHPSSELGLGSSIQPSANEEETQSTTSRSGLSTLPTYAYVCIVCLPLILIAVLVYWWIRRRRQRQKDVLDATRPGKLHLFAVDE